MNALIGFVLALLAGISVGFSMWPLKWARLWRWENFWFFYSFFSLIVFPIGLGFAVLPHLGAVYQSLTMRQILLPLLLGTFWGFAQLGAGICIQRLGLAVSGAVINGVGGAMGTVMPLVALHRGSVMTSSGLVIFTGTVLMLVGAVLCGWSGHLREEEARLQSIGSGFGREQAAMRQDSLGRSAYFLTLLIAIASGILAALLNIALAYGSGIIALAQQRGGQPAWAPFAVWPIALCGGSMANFGYTIYLLLRHKTWARFRQFSLQEFSNPVLAGILWMGGIAIYSSATTLLGHLGVSIGFGIFTITMILSGQLVAVITGEWRRMKPRTYVLFIVGITVLVIAVLTIGVSNYLQA